MMTVLRIGLVLLHVSIVSARFVLPPNNSTAVPTRDDYYGHLSSLEKTSPPLGHIFKRQGTYSSTGALLCSSTQTCVDGSCCNSKGVCGYGPSFCGSDVCTSQCDATAMCGKYSAGGSVKCGMNICCSGTGWCGTTQNYCSSPPNDPQDGCQSAFGSCEVVPTWSCSPGSGSSAQRTIGYYQASNVRDRLCNKISPSQIVTAGYSHLYFAFASIDSSSFAIVPANPSDEALYEQFTSLQSGSLETWIAIGGFDFSNGGTTWSTMVSSSSNRQAFIQSLISFMQKYNFQGVDLDWEYPVDPARGGSPVDTENFVSLVSDMHAAFGGKYGISVTLAPDYWYLRDFDAIKMQPYVDWFGFMAYDLHGSWDVKTPALGNIVRGQANISDIETDMAPLWFDGLDPKKINLGLPYYGRGYTLSDPSCNTPGCRFSGPNNPGVCTNTAGMLSLNEIKDIIKDKGLTPANLQGALMKSITWDDQWIGYDDEETISAKKLVANQYCLGGTMAWSVDFNSGTGSGTTPPVSTDGTCGSQGGALCPDGQCCSSYGYCSKDYCGSGCFSGPCIVGGVTTDGTCGVGHWNSTCGGDYPGCCSEGGWCGSTDDYCSSGHQSAYDTPLPTIPSVTSITGHQQGQPTGVYTTVIPVSSCLPYADPDSGDNGSCQCSGYTGKIPKKTGDSVCDYTAYTETVTPITAPPGYTTTLANSKVLVYPSTGALDGTTYGTGSPKTILNGKTMKTQLNPTASAMVGSLTGAPLYTSISNAIAEACPFTSGTPITQCEEAKITGISYVAKDRLHTDGVLEIGFPYVDITDADALEAIIRSLAGVARINSEIPNATSTYMWLEDDTTGPRPVITRHYPELTLIPALIQILYTEETDETDGGLRSQLLGMSMNLETEETKDYGCAIGTMVADSVAGISALLALVALVPGFEWLAAIDSTILATEGALSAGVAEGISLNCGLGEILAD